MKLVNLGITKDMGVIYKSLPYFLSNELFVTLDEKIQDARSNYFSKKNELVSLHKKLAEKKDEYVVVFKELNKQRTISSIIKSINTLKTEGILVGNNRNKVRNILRNLGTANATSLQALDSDLKKYANKKII